MLRISFNIRLIHLIISFTVSLFFLLPAQAQESELSNFKAKFENIDRSVYFNVALNKENYIIGGYKFLYINASRYYNGEVVSFFYDTTKTFYRNKALKYIQIQDTIGIPTKIVHYDRQGNITRICDYSRLEFVGVPKYKDLQLLAKVRCRKYRNGNLIFDGTTISKSYKSSKKIGVHKWYNSEGGIKKTKKYDAKDE
jgi:hypothetical protein